MAAGVPATGIGGIYYIILTVGLLFYKLAKKAVCIFKNKLCKGDDNRFRMRKIFPPLAFAFCISLLAFMNITGFRFNIPGTTTVTLSIEYLWVIGAFSVIAAIVFIVLVHFRAQRIKK